MLLTSDDRAEWVENALPTGAKYRFKVLQEAERKDRVNSTMIEVN